MKLGIVAGAFCLATIAYSADWPQWRGPNGDGISREKLNLSWTPSGPREAWRANVGTGYSSITVSSGRAYTMGNSNGQDTVWCLDAVKGQKVWSHSYPSRLDPQYYDGGPNATPTVAGHRVYTLSKWGDVFCLDTSKGKVLWDRKLWEHGIRSNRWGFAGSPVIWKDLVILNAGTSGVALDKNTGRTVWFNGTNVAGYATPQIVRIKGQDVVLIFGAKNLYATEPLTGRELWHQPFQTGYDVNNTDPIIYSGKVFLSSYSRGCGLFPLDGGPPVYTNKNISCHLGPGIVFGDFLYAFSGEANMNTDLRCIHLPSGELRWARKDPKFGAMAGVDHKLLVISEKGELIVADVTPEDYRPIARGQVLEPVCWTPPTAANGRVYLRNSKGVVVCLDLRR
jgi:outer membrane protein assembly factor BamB